LSCTRRLLASVAGIDAKSNFGSAYTAVNRDMYSMICKHGLVVRMPEPDRSAFLERGVVPRRSIMAAS
jgi:hypothetical protein